MTPTKQPLAQLEILINIGRRRGDGQIAIDRSGVEAPRSDTDAPGIVHHQGVRLHGAQVGRPHPAGGANLGAAEDH